MGQIGDILRRAREERDITLLQAEKDTKIRANYLGALEEDDYANLPSDVFARGFVRTYAEYLGLDSRSILSIFDRKGGRRRRMKKPVEEAKEIKLEPAALPPRTSSRMLPSLIAGFTVVIIAAAVFTWFYTAIFPPPAATPTTVAEFPSLTPGQGASSTTGFTPTPAAVMQFRDRVEVTARWLGDSWVRVRADGKQTYEGMLRAGSARTWVGQTEVSILFGDSGMVETSFNGQPQGLVGERGMVVEKKWVRPAS